MKLDTSRAWQDATAMVSTNREVLLAVAGVFIALPTLTMTLLFPYPEIAFGMDPRVILAMLSEYYGKAAPWQIASAVPIAVGTLAVLTLLTDRERPTVGAAIGAGLRGFLSLLATSLIVVLVLMATLLPIFLIAAVTGSPVLTLLLALPILAGAIHIAVRWYLAIPVIAIEHQRNPFMALQRSWTLTDGHTSRILLFLLLLGAVYLVVMLIGVGLIGGIALAALGHEAGKIASAIAAAVLSTAFSVYLNACLAALHGQLSGEASKSPVSTFE